MFSVVKSLLKDFVRIPFEQLTLGVLGTPRITPEPLAIPGENGYWIRLTGKLGVGDVDNLSVNFHPEMAPTLKLPVHQLATKAVLGQNLVKKVRGDTTCTTQVVVVDVPDTVRSGHLLDFGSGGCSDLLDSVELLRFHAILNSTPQSMDLEASMKVYIVFDGDHIGRMVGRATLADKPEEVRILSQKIDQGNLIFKMWCESFGGSVINIGGDEGRLEVETTRLHELPGIRDQYEQAVGATVSVGVGMALSLAQKALAAAKIKGGDQITFYSPEVDVLLADVTEKPEGQKIADEYLNKSDVGSGGLQTQHRLVGAPAGDNSEVDALMAELEGQDPATAGQGEVPQAVGMEALQNQFRKLAGANDQQNRPPASVSDATKAKIVGIIEFMQKHPEELQLLKLRNPQLYASINQLVSAMIDMARKGTPTQGLGKSEDLNKVLPDRKHQGFRPGRPMNPRDVEAFRGLTARNPEQAVVADHLMEHGFAPEARESGDAQLGVGEGNFRSKAETKRYFGAAAANRNNPDLMTGHHDNPDDFSRVASRSLDSASPIPSIRDPADPAFTMHFRWQAGKTPDKHSVMAISNPTGSPDLRGSQFSRAQFHLDPTTGKFHINHTDVHAAPDDEEPVIPNLDEEDDLNHVIGHLNNHLNTSNTWKAELEKAALEAGKTGRHAVVLPVGTTKEPSAGGDNRPQNSNERKIQTADGKTHWVSIAAGVVMSPQGQATSSRNPGGIKPKDGSQ